MSGSRDKNIVKWKLDKNPAYGLVGTGLDYVKEVIDDLIREGYLKREGEPGRPVLTLTDIGARAAVNANLDDLFPARQNVSGGHRRPVRDVRLAALKCVDGLDAPVGVMKVASILTGSKARWVAPIGADKLDVYGSVDDLPENVRETIKSMLEEGLLLKGGSDRYPVLKLTEAGRNELERPGAGLPAEAHQAAESDLGKPLDAMIRQLLTAEPEKAKQMLPELRMYHPSEIVQRLIMNFDGAAESRVRARSVWALGVLGAQHGLAFLIRCADSDETNIRRLAASALGKVATTVSGESKTTAIEMEKAQQALLQLTEDPAPQVRQYAKKSLDQFSPKNPP